MYFSEITCFWMDPIRLSYMFVESYFVFLFAKYFGIWSAVSEYIKTCLNRPLKKKTKNWFTRPSIA